MVQMDNTFIYTGSEANLYDLLMWWGKMAPFEHSDECDTNGLHCCEGKPYTANALIGAEVSATKHGDPFPIYFQFLKGKRAGKKYDLNPGDMILFDNGEFSFKESCECVVISQDWP